MTIRIVAGLVIFLGVPVFGCAGTIAGFRVIEAVNAKLPERERFEPFGWYLSKSLRLRDTYHHLYPDGRLLRRQGVFSAIGLGCLVTAAALIGFPLFAVAGLGVVGSFILRFMYFTKPPNSQGSDRTSPPDGERNTSS